MVQTTWPQEMCRSVLEDLSDGKVFCSQQQMHSIYKAKSPTAARRLTTAKSAIDK